MLSIVNILAAQAEIEQAIERHALWTETRFIVANWLKANGVPEHTNVVTGTICRTARTIAAEISKLLADPDLSERLLIETPRRYSIASAAAALSDRAATARDFCFGDIYEAVNGKPYDSRDANDEAVDDADGLVSAVLVHVFMRAGDALCGTLAPEAIEELEITEELLAA